MALHVRFTFASPTAIRASRVLLAVAGSVSAASLYLTLIPDETGARLSGLALLAAIGIGALSLRGMVGPPFSAKDHLRPGERRRLTVTVAATLTVVVCIMAIPLAMLRPPVWACVILVALYGPAFTITAVAGMRLFRDKARWGCPGAYDDCRDCDTIMQIHDLNIVLEDLADEAVETWRTDPETGVELRVRAKRNRIETHTIDDQGHELERVYLLGGITGARVPRLIAVVTYDDGFQEMPSLSTSECERMSLGPAAVQAVRDQVARTYKNPRPV